MRITVQVRQSTATALHRIAESTATNSKESRRELQSAEAEELLRLVNELGVRLEPMHTGTRDSELQTFFTVDVPDSHAADRVISRLRECSALEGAYIKPLDEVP